ncbi:hypothetical protein MTR_1g016395 [Medicago truncatula]|uniref:Uncharacterized protein n=1 Tax=Medicago truncatula TaxID=3880 RepID=A0A072VET5_MEDTR|nr:hypothetical protein MTR_1g016395 [Medicago truncatula]
MAHTVDSVSVCNSCKASLLEHKSAGNSRGKAPLTLYPIMQNDGNLTMPADRFLP